jgi:hypothetical protein
VPRGNNTGFYGRSDGSFFDRLGRHERSRALRSNYNSAELPDNRRYNAKLFVARTREFFGSVN